MVSRWIGLVNPPKTFCDIWKSTNIKSKYEGKSLSLLPDTFINPIRTLPPYLPPWSLPLWVHLSIHLPVLATRSHLVAQQHDDHILLGVLMDLCQPCLEKEREHILVRKPTKKGERKGGSTEEKRDGRGEWLPIDGGDKGDGWTHSERKR